MQADLDPEMGTGVVAVEAEQLAKLRSELDVVQQNCKVMSEMLTELTPGQEPIDDDWQLLTVRYSSIVVSEMSLMLC